MKAIVTILDDNNNIVEKDKVIFPVKSDTTFIKEGGEDRLKADKYEFRFFFTAMKPFEGRCLM